MQPILAPSTSPTNPLPDIVFFGATCPDNKFDLCSGDCDNDDECIGSLRCAQRKRQDGLENVPGCRFPTGTEDVRLSDWDFCKYMIHLVVK